MGRATADDLSTVFQTATDQAAVDRVTPVPGFRLGTNAMPVRQEVERLSIGR